MLKVRMFYLPLKTVSCITLESQCLSTALHILKFSEYLIVEGRKQGCYILSVSSTVCNSLYRFSHLIFLTTHQVRCPHFADERTGSQGQMA